MKDSLRALKVLAHCKYFYFEIDVFLLIGFEGTKINKVYINLSFECIFRKHSTFASYFTQGNYTTVGSDIVAIAIVGRGG